MTLVSGLYMYIYIYIDIRIHGGKDREDIMKRGGVPEGGVPFTYLSEGLIQGTRFKEFVFAE